MIVLLIFALFNHPEPSGAVMTQQPFNASDFCAMKVIVRCFTQSQLGLPRQTCGAQNILELARQGVGNRERCMQATKITKWLQTPNIDTGALRNEVTTDCGAFLQINRCVEPFREKCEHVFKVFGLNMFLQQWNYLCDYSMYPRLEKHIICKQEIPDKAHDECRKFAPVLGVDFENSSFTADLTEAECTKYKLIMGCKARVLLSRCDKGRGLLAALFLIDFFNIQAESIGSSCQIDKLTDPVKLASTYEKFIRKEIIIFFNETKKSPPKLSSTIPPVSTSSNAIKSARKSPFRFSSKETTRPPSTTTKKALRKSKFNDNYNEVFFVQHGPEYDYLYEDEHNFGAATLCSCLVVSVSIVFCRFVFQLIV